jgi:hypothetical protein
MRRGGGSLQACSGVAGHVEAFTVGVRNGDCVGRRACAKEAWKRS